MITAQVALLVDRFHLTIPEIAKLTDRQLHQVYFHKRTKEGMIEIPMPSVEMAMEAEETEEKTLRDLAALLDSGFIVKQDFERLKQDVAAKYHGENQTDER